LVDLVRFELTTSSMPFKKYQSPADNLAQNKRLSKRRSGLRWTPREFTSETARSMLSRARLKAVVIVVSSSRQRMISL